MEPGFVIAHILFSPFGELLSVFTNIRRHCSVFCSSGSAARPRLSLMLCMSAQGQGCIPEATSGWWGCAPATPGHSWGHPPFAVQVEVKNKRNKNTPLWLFVPFWILFLDQRLLFVCLFQFFSTWQSGQVWQDSRAYYKKSLEEDECLGSMWIRRLAVLQTDFFSQGFGSDKATWNKLSSIQNYCRNNPQRELPFLQGMKKELKKKK